jgi:hypothetical protein
VAEAIELLGTAGGIGHKNLVFRRSAIASSRVPGAAAPSA